jgi:hypothetical protein
MLYENCFIWKIVFHLSNLCFNNKTIILLKQCTNITHFITNRGKKNLLKLSIIFLSRKIFNNFQNKNIKRIRRQHVIFINFNNRNNMLNVIYILLKCLFKLCIMKVTYQFVDITSYA